MADALFPRSLSLSSRSNLLPLLFLPFRNTSPGFNLAARSGSTAALSRPSIPPPPRLKVRAVVQEAADGPKWWEKTAGPNMIDVHSTPDFLDALSQAGDRLVIVEFYGTWCGSCRALFPKLCKTAKEHPDILFLKVNFDENKPMCKRLNVRVLPYFHFYRGADGLLESFSCNLAKFQKIKDAIEKHNTDRCSLLWELEILTCLIAQPLRSQDCGQMRCPSCLWTRERVRICFATFKDLLFPLLPSKVLRLHEKE